MIFILLLFIGLTWLLSRPAPPPPPPPPAPTDDDDDEECEDCYE